MISYFFYYSRFVFAQFAQLCITIGKLSYCEKRAEKVVVPLYVPVGLPLAICNPQNRFPCTDVVEMGAARTKPFKVIGVLLKEKPVP